MAQQQQRLFGGTDDFLVTRELAQVATRNSAMAIVDCLFAVAAVDRRLLAAEAERSRASLASCAWIRRPG